jgi:hypothetical protein
MRLQEAIDGCRADVQEDRAQGWGHVQHPMALKGLDERRQERREPFPAQIVTSFPHGVQERRHLGAVAAGPAWTRGGRSGPVPEEADSRLPVPSCEAAKFGKHAPLLGVRGEAVAWMEGCGVFVDAARAHDACSVR